MSTLFFQLNKIMNKLRSNEINHHTLTINQFEIKHETSLAITRLQEIKLVNEEVYLAWNGGPPPLLSHLKSDIESSNSVTHPYN